MLRSVSNTAGVNPMPMPTAVGGKQSMTANVYRRGSIEFGEFELTKEGTYIYEITEVDGKLDGYKVLQIVKTFSEMPPQARS